MSYEIHNADGSISVEPFGAFFDRQRSLLSELGPMDADFPTGDVERMLVLVGNSKIANYLDEHEDEVTMTMPTVIWEALLVIAEANVRAIYEK